MKKNEFLQDAIGLIDQKLVMEAGAPETKRPTAHWTRWVAVAACLALLLGGLGYFLPRGETLPEADSGTITITENLWQQENFSAFSLSYRSAGLTTTDASNGGKVVFLTNTTSSQ